MMRRPITLLALTLLATGCSALRGRSGGDEGGPAAPGTTARAAMRDAQGRSIGEVTLTQTPNGVLLIGQLSGLTEGTHGFHVHTIGKCDPTFDAAGGHFNPTGRRHGARNADGQHAGDLPNITVPAGGTVRVELFATGFDLGTGKLGVFDADGSALMLHANPDDYQSDPAGAAGTRIACGVIVR